MRTKYYKSLGDRSGGSEWLKNQKRMRDIYSGGQNRYLVQVPKETGNRFADIIFKRTTACQVTNERLTSPFLETAVCLVYTAIYRHTGSFNSCGADHGWLGEVEKPYKSDIVWAKTPNSTRSE